MHDTVYTGLALDAEVMTRISDTFFGTAIRVMEKSYDQIPGDLARDARRFADGMSASLTAKCNSLLQARLAELPEGTTEEEARVALQPVLFTFSQNLRRSALKKTIEWAQKRVAEDQALVVGFDLDNCALQWQALFVPLAQALVAAGHKVGVLTGNHTDTARESWDESGYPEPAFWLVHENHEMHIAAWKARMCREQGIDLLIDDFKQGHGAETFRLESDHDHLGLQVLLPPGTPAQAVGADRVKGFNESIERVNLKYHVPTDLVPSVAAVMARAAKADRFDPQFRGQEIESTYFDTVEGYLLQAKQADRSYVTLRLRHYPNTDTYFLEAKTPEAKHRVEIAHADAAFYRAGSDVLSRAAAVLPMDVAAKLVAVAHHQPLQPVATVRYRRYARESGSRRLTLDLNLRTDEGKTYGAAVLELKYESGVVPYPELDALELEPTDLSKFTWALAPA